MQLPINKEMISGALLVLEEALEWPDFPYTNEQMVEAMLREAMKHYVHPKPPKPEPKPKKPDNDEGFVYFVFDGDAIKIGKAINVKSRLSGLRTSSSRQLTCLGVVKGGHRKERELHKQFKEFWIKGEWFQDCDAIREYIAKSARPLAANGNRRSGRKAA